MIEKRRNQRLPMQALLTYDILDASGSAVSEGMARTHDVSNDGLRLETVRELARGDLLEITIGAGDRLLVVHGEVVWTDETEPEGHAGIRVSSDDAPRLQSLTKLTADD